MENNTSRLEITLKVMDLKKKHENEEQYNKEIN